jgi:hypothetical protein
MESRLILAILSASGLALAALADAQERIAISGTSVTLTAPPGFARARSGLEHAATGSSITISETSGEAYAELAERFSSPKSLSEGYASQGTTIRAVRRIAADGAEVPFAIGRQTTNARKEFAKYFALLKGDKTVLVTFTIADRALTEADAEAVVRSIELTPGPTLEQQIAQLPFTFRAVEPFGVANVTPRQAVTLEPAGGQRGSGDPIVIVIGRGRSRALIGEEATVAMELLTRTGGFRDVEITSQAPAAFAGGNGYLINGVVENRSVVQYLRILAGGSYLRFLARGETSAMQAAEATIMEIARSVEPN